MNLRPSARKCSISIFVLFLLLSTLLAYVYLVCGQSFDDAVQKNSIIHYPTAHNHAFFHQPASCQSADRSQPKLVLFVSSRPNGFENRQSIRETWGSNAVTCSVKIIFGFGAVHNYALMRQIAIESDKYGDILQSSDIEDSYRNQTSLILAFFRWTVRHDCEGSYVGKADDDVWINFRPILAALDAINVSAAFAAGFFFPNGTPVQRATDHPQSLTRAEREDDFYPAYASGVFYAFPWRMMEILLTTAGKMKQHWIDDVFITGREQKKNSPPPKVIMGRKKTLYFISHEILK